MVIGSGNSELRQPTSPSSPSAAIRCFFDAKVPQCWGSEIYLAALGWVQEPAWEAGLGTHCCGEFASARVAALHAVGRFPQSKPATGRRPRRLPRSAHCFLRAGGFSVNPDHFPDLGHGSMDARADMMEECLGAEGVAPTGPWGGCVDLSSPHRSMLGAAACWASCMGPPGSAGPPGAATDPSRTQGRGIEMLLPHFPAGSWARN